MEEESRSRVSSPVSSRGVKFGPKTLFDTIIYDFEDVLSKAYMINGSFEDILAGKLDPNKRRKQLVVILFNSFYFIPRYIIFCILYLLDEKTRIFFQYYLVDWFEEFGLFGRTLNVCYVI